MVRWRRVELEVERTGVMEKDGEMEREGERGQCGLFHYGES